MLVDADLRSGRRLETGHRSESIIYNLGLNLSRNTDAKVLKRFNMHAYHLLNCVNSPNYIS